jgi:cell division protein FtsX
MMRGFLEPPALLALGGALACWLCAQGKVPLRYNLRNLMVRWRTTALTALAFTVVVTLLTVMLGFVAGMGRVVRGSSQPGNVVILSSGATDETNSFLTVADVADVELQEGVLADARGRPLCSRELCVVVNQPVPGPAGKPSRYRTLQVRGVEDPEVSAEVHGLDLLPGGAWFSDAGVREAPAGEGGWQGSAVEMVVGEGLARQLARERGAAALQVGDRFDVGERPCVVVGLLKSRSAGSTFDNEAWAKLTTVGQAFNKENMFTNLVLRTADAAQARALADYLTAEYKKAALKAYPETDIQVKLMATSRQLLGTILFVTVVMAVGGIFGCLNTMFAAISLRARDIGVLRILGYSRRQILVSFLFESLAIALLGGGLGCGIGSLFDGATATGVVGGGALFTGRSVSLKIVVSTGTLAVGVLLVLVMGALGGLLPALAAVRLKPLEAVR